MAQTLGRYELIEKLPGGTDARATFLARKPSSDEVVELRVTKACAHATSCASGCGPRSCDARTNKVAHPNLERAREYDADRGVLLTVADHREAIPLPDYLAARAGLEADVVLDLLVPVGAALAEVHEADYVHGGVAPDRVLVEESSDRAYLPHLPACSSLGLYEDLECRPQDNPGCPAVPAGARAPRVADDVAGFLGLVREAVQGPEAPVVHDALAEIDPESTSMPDVLERLRLLRLLIQEHRDRRRGKVSMMNMQLRQRKQATRAMVAPDLPELTFWGRVNRSFDRSSGTSKAGLFLLLAAVSFPVPVVDQVMAATAPPPPVVVRARPAAKPKARPAAKPKVPALKPEVAALMKVAEEVWKTPTNEKTFAPRLKVVWTFFKAQPAKVREELGGKEVLLDLRKLAARSKAEGARALDQLISRCHQQVKAAQRRAQEQARAKAPPASASPTQGRS
jgi:hypothetical protein